MALHYLYVCMYVCMYVCDKLSNHCAGLIATVVFPVLRLPGVWTYLVPLEDMSVGVYALF